MRKIILCLLTQFSSNVNVYTCVCVWRVYVCVNTHVTRACTCTSAWVRVQFQLSSAQTRAGVSASGGMCCAIRGGIAQRVGGRFCRGPSWRLFRICTRLDLEEVEASGAGRRVIVPASLCFPGADGCRRGRWRATRRCISAGYRGPVWTSRCLYCPAR